MNAKRKIVFSLPSCLSSMYDTLYVIILVLLKVRYKHRVHTTLLKQPKSKQSFINPFYIDFRSSMKQTNSYYLMLVQIYMHKEISQKYSNMSRTSNWIL